MAVKNGKQIIRLIRFVSELKNNSYPNASSFAAKLREVDIDENLNISCNSRTIQRDIKMLRDTFGAPIKYSSENHGYYLTRKTWEFHCPVYCDELISYFMISAKLAEGITPQPLKNSIINAASEVNTSNNSEFLDKSFLDSLIIASGTKTSINAEVFKNVFDGWRNQEALEIEYQRPDGKKSNFDFEPHIISFHKGIWYSKGILIKNNKVVILALQRIKSAKLKNVFFQINRKMLEDVKKNGLFDYKKIENITLLCDHSIGFYLYEHQPVKKFKIEPQEDGSYIVELAPAVEHEVVKWILGEGGKVQVVKPEYLRTKVLDAAENIILKNVNIR